MNKFLKSPLTSGKGCSIYKLETCNPNMDNVIEFRDCFLGGGSYPLYISQLYPHLDIWVNDLYEPVYNFWCNLKENGEKMCEDLLLLKEGYNDCEMLLILFEECREVLEIGNSYERAIAFLVLNNFTEKNIRKLPAISNVIKNWVITNLDYNEVLSTKDIYGLTFVYLDPPHYIYQDKFYRDCNKQFNKKSMLISYKDNEEIKNKFIKWKKNKPEKDKNKLILFNY